MPQDRQGRKDPIDAGQQAEIVIVEDVNGAECKVQMPIGWDVRGRPDVGDYVVIYEDGYKSWSPAAAFEAGYSRLLMADAKAES